MDRHVDRALGTKIGVGIPGDVGEQAGGKPQPRRAGAVVGEQRRDPLVERRTMIAEATEPLADFERAGKQRILRAGRFVEVAIENALRAGRTPIR